MLSRRTSSRIKSIKSKRLAIAYRAIKSLYPLLDQIRSGIYEASKEVKGEEVTQENASIWNNAGRIVGDLGATYAEDFANLQNSAPQVTSFQEFRVLLKGFQLMDSNPEAVLNASGGDLYSYLNIISGQVASLIDKLSKLNLQLSSDAATVLREAVSNMTSVIEDKSRNTYNGAYIIDNLIEVWNAINERYPFKQFKKLASGWETVIQNLFQSKELMDKMKARRSEYDAKMATLRTERDDLENKAGSYTRYNQLHDQINELMQEREGLDKIDDAVVTKLTRQAATWFLKLADIIEQNQIDLTNVSEAGKSLRSNKFVNVKGVNRRISLGEYYATIRSVIKASGDIPSFDVSMSLMKEQMQLLKTLDEIENKLVDTAEELSGKDYGIRMSSYTDVSGFRNENKADLEHWLGADVLYELAKEIRTSLAMPFWKHISEKEINLMFMTDPRAISKAQSAVELANLTIMKSISDWKEDAYDAIVDDGDGGVKLKDAIDLLNAAARAAAHDVADAADAIMVARSLIGNKFKIPEAPDFPPEDTRPNLYDTRGRGGNVFGSGEPYRRSISKKSVYNKAKAKALSKIRQRLLN